MKNQKLWIGVGIGLVAIIIIAVALSMKPESSESGIMEQVENAINTSDDGAIMESDTAIETVIVDDSADTTATNTDSTGTTTYTMADVAQHKTQKDCWSAVNGGVYDLTEAISMHPGGPAAIAGICGVDGSSQFNKQHGSSQEANAALASFKIGDLQ